MAPRVHDGFKELASAIIEQAVADYRGLVDSGKVKGLKLTVKGREKSFKCKGGYVSNSQVVELLWFLSPRTGILDSLLVSAGINLCPIRIRRELGIPANDVGAGE